MNIVQVVHLEEKNNYNVKRYTFRVPDGVELKKGQIVQVKNKYGLNIAECVTNSHEVDEEVLEMVMEGKKVKASVTGIYSLTKFVGDDNEH